MGAHTVGHDMFSAQKAHMAGLTVKSSYTKSRFKNGFCVLLLMLSAMVHLT